MKIDAWTHFLSPTYYRELERRGLAGFYLGVGPLCDAAVRREEIARHGDYRQILTPLLGGDFFGDKIEGPGGYAELVAANNDDMAELVARHEEFAGFAAGTVISDPDLATEEAIRSVRDLGALGVQLEVDPINLPLHDERYEPLLAAMEELGAAVWLHPSRTPMTPGLPPDTAPFLLWQVLGWPFDSTIAVARMIFAGVLDRHPGLKLIVHHGGGTLPLLAGRLAIMSGYAPLDPSGRLDAQLAGLKRAPVDYLQMLYVDTALFGNPSGMKCVVDFFDPSHILFATDTPWDMQGGAQFIPETISDVEAATESAEVRAGIFANNAVEVLGVKI